MDGNGNGIQFPDSSGQSPILTNPVVVIYGSRTPTQATPATPIRQENRYPDVDEPSRNNYTRPQEALSQTTISWNPLAESSEYVISCQPFGTEEEPAEVTYFSLFLKERGKMALGTFLGKMLYT